MRHCKVVRDLIILKTKNKLIKRLKENGYPSIHGHKVWKSSFLIMDYLDRHPIKQGSRVIELGAGWGLLSIYLNRTFDARVTAVDADRNVFPFLELMGVHPLWQSYEGPLRRSNDTDPHLLECVEKAQSKEGFYSKKRFLFGLTVQ